MNPTQITQNVSAKLDAATEHFRTELGKIRTGRAHPGMLDSIMVEVYGQSMPLKAVASITVPEPQLLQITPFDANNLKAVSEAISADKSLDLNPSDDGRVVRIQIPPLTTETRASMVKIVNQKLEDCLISARQARHDAHRQLDEAEKSKEIGKDEHERLKKQIDELMEKQKNEAEAQAAAKEKEITTI